MLWYLAQIATEAGLDLDAVAGDNIEKLLSRQYRTLLAGQRRRPLTRGAAVRPRPPAGRPPAPGRPTASSSLHKLTIVASPRCEPARRSAYHL